MEGDDAFILLGSMSQKRPAIPEMDGGGVFVLLGSRQWRSPLAESMRATPTVRQLKLKQQPPNQTLPPPNYRIKQANASKEQRMRQQLMGYEDGSTCQPGCVERLTRKTLPIHSSMRSRLTPALQWLLFDQKNREWLWTAAV
jgi:hypothetical protein|mmetsp:Transcript_24073/g.41493  ORF Transcript_24073/g.41493 Transcript_24073/m.41493 type:complete len:142 (+) Transcript_24073:274-699(+)